MQTVGRQQGHQALGLGLAPAHDPYPAAQALLVADPVCQRQQELLLVPVLAKPGRQLAVGLDADRHHPGPRRIEVVPALDYLQEL